MYNSHICWEKAKKSQLLSGAPLAGQLPVIFVNARRAAGAQTRVAAGAGAAAARDAWNAAVVMCAFVCMECVVLY
jgi:hypothetical protein